MELTDDQHLAAIEAAYAAIEGRGRGLGVPEDTISLAQVLFSDGFEAALSTLPTLLDNELPAFESEAVKALKARGFKRINSPRRRRGD